MAPGLAIMFNERLYQRCKDIATNMSQARGIVPPHLLDKPVSCFAVLTRSITWKLDPFAVAQCTYETPGGKVGYEGKLVQAILEQSGKLEGGVKYELFGDWSRIRGKFKKAKSDKGKDYFVPGWDPEKDEDGLGVRVSAQVKGEAEPRTEEFFLKSFWPRNSTLWALRPDQQIKYAAARAFSNIAMPGIMMGVPFDMDERGDGMVDITPARPERKAFDKAASATEVDWSKAGEAEARTAEPMAPAEHEGDASGAAEAEASDEETHAPFGHADAHALGERYFDEKRPLSPPSDLAEEYHDAFKAGWEAREAEVAAEKKAKKG